MTANNTIWIPTFQVDYITSVSLEIKVSFTIIACTIFPLSYAMMYGIIRFELDGGDPQKRSTFNQLNSALFSIMDIYYLRFCWVHFNAYQSLGWPFGLHCRPDFHASKTLLLMLCWPFDHDHASHQVLGPDQAQIGEQNEGQFLGFLIDLPGWSFCGTGTFC